MARSFVSGGTTFLEFAGALVTAHPFTLAGWAYPTQSSTAGTMASIANSANTTEYYRLDQAAANTLRFRAAAGGSTNDSSSTGTFATDAWNHCACRAVSATARNNILNNAFSGNTNNSKAPSGLNRTAFGCQAGSSRSQFFQGGLAEWALWDVALTDAEITALYRGAYPPSIRPADLVSYWPLLGRTSPEIDPVGRQDMAVTGATASDHCRISRPPFLG